MDHKKERVKIKKLFGVDGRLFIKTLFLLRYLHAGPLHVDQDDKIEEEGDEDKDDAAENPNCKGCQPS